MESDLSSDGIGLQKREAFSQLILEIEEQLYLQGTPLTQAEILSFLFEKIIENNKKQIAKSSIRGRDLISILGDPKLMANQIIERKYPMVNVDEDNLDLHSRTLRKLKINFSEPKSKSIHKIILFLHYSLVVFFLFTGLQSIYSSLFILTSSNSYQRTFKLFDGNNILFFDTLFTPNSLLISSISLFFVELTYISFLKLPSSQKIFTEIPKNMKRLRRQIKLIFLNSQFFGMYLVLGSIIVKSGTTQRVNGYDPIKDLLFPIIIFEFFMLFVIIMTRKNSKRLEQYVQPNLNINIIIRIFHVLTRRLMQLFTIGMIILIFLQVKSDIEAILSITNYDYYISISSSLINFLAFSISVYLIFLIVISSFYLSDDENNNWIKSISRQFIIQIIFAVLYLIFAIYLSLKYNEFMMPIDESLLISQSDIVFNFIKYFIPSILMLLIFRSNK